jgi:hypothetical protein
MIRYWSGLLKMVQVCAFLLLLNDYKDMIVVHCLLYNECI